MIEKILEADVYYFTRKIIKNIFKYLWKAHDNFKIWVLIILLKKLLKIYKNSISTNAPRLK